VVVLAIVRNLRIDPMLVLVVRLGRRRSGFVTEEAEVGKAMLMDELFCRIGTHMLRARGSQ